MRDKILLWCERAFFKVLKMRLQLSVWHAIINFRGIHFYFLFQICSFDNMTILGVSLHCVMYNTQQIIRSLNKDDEMYAVPRI